MSSKKRGAKVTVICENPACGIQFQARVADRKRGWGKFHNKACAAIVKNSKVVEDGKSQTA